METKPFAPKGEEELKNEILTETGLTYEGNEEVIDKLVARGLKDEEFKASLHKQKEETKRKNEIASDFLKKAGIDSETGEKLGSKEPKPDLTNDDVFALVEAKVPKADIEEIKNAAKILGLSVADALENQVVKTLLAHKQQERTTAAATHIGTTHVASPTAKKSILTTLDNYDEMTDEEAVAGAEDIVEMLKKGDIKNHVR